MFVASCITLGISLQLLLHLFLFTLFLYIHSVLNTSVKVSGGAHHYLSRKTSLNLLSWLCYVKCARAIRPQVKYPG